MNYENTIRRNTGNMVSPPFCDFDDKMFVIPFCDFHDKMFVIPFLSNIFALWKNLKGTKARK